MDSLCVSDWGIVTMKTMALKIGAIAASTAVLGAFLSTSATAATEFDLAALHNELELAVCLNEWPYALDVIDPIIASRDISQNYRAELIQFRDQLQHYAVMQAVIPQSSTCDAVLARTISADRVFSTEPPLDWAGSIYALTNPGNPRPASRRQPAQLHQITQVVVNDVNDPIPLLSPATLVDLSNGSNVVAGAVSTDYEVFSFLAGLGDRVSLEINVTEILPGTLYNDDDSQLFLFDNNGRLLTENDDLSGLQSGIQDFVIPATGYYYAVVTTYNNDPILNAEQVISGWSDNGGSNIEYTLTIRGVTPTAQLLRPAVQAE